MKTVSVWDIETEALSGLDLPPFDQSQVALGALKDPDKIKAKIEAAMAQYVADAALSPLTGRIAMVGWKEIGKEPELWIDSQSGQHFGMGEASLIGAILSRISQEIADGNIVAGFNSSSFDLPFLAKRAWKHRLKVPKMLREGRYWSRQLVDLREEWLLGERAPTKGTSSLEAVANFLGLPPKLGSGADFAGMDLEQRKSYLTADLVTTEALWMRLN